MITDYHAKLFANELARRCPSDSIEKFAATLMGSKVDLNPHQIDAALFAFRSPLSNGAILADEVGLGKTIEAGIVLSQKWAERNRKILLILPSSLRKQWHQELQEKFYLPSVIIEARTFNKAIKSGKNNPFEIKEIAIVSYHFARNKADFVRRINWDLVVFDEAHQLRNVYKTGNKIARELKRALNSAPKLLLTATPLQNTLLELYGLVSFIDEHAFGDLKSFKHQFAKLSADTNFDDLKLRLEPVCKRTLRRQVLEYIRYTERKAYTQEFVPTEDEEVLYDLVSEYLRRPNIQALPPSQRTLMTLVLRKLLASSTFAIAGALESLANKLERRLKMDDRVVQVLEDIEEDFEAFEELAEELGIEDPEELEPLTQEQRQTIREEIEELNTFFELAMEISQNAKGESLLQALQVGFKMTDELGGVEKAVIFTESRRTQNYLLKLLSEDGYEDDIVLFNGSNNDEKSREIYTSWKERNKGTDLVTGSHSADIRAALVEHFRDQAKIMIATEAAAEGINLQFCSMVVNYDLPWNPQRIEQRIGRCHRYGQKHDVVVVNFLNKNNAADQRVYQLLAEKFRLFNGVFGASDEVLGSIESGVDFEKRIVEIYQTCRTGDEIQSSFDALQAELSSEIDAKLKDTRRKLLENFDAEVAEKLHIYKAEATESLNRYEALLWDLTQHELNNRAKFNETTLTFQLSNPPTDKVKSGLYTLKPNEGLGHHYRLQHVLAEWVLDRAMGRKLPEVELIFDYTSSTGKISILEPLIGQSGLLTARRLTVTALESEDYIIITARNGQGEALSAEQARRLFSLPAQPGQTRLFPDDGLVDEYERQRNAKLDDITQRNAIFFEEEMDKLNRWADDKRTSLKSVLKDHDDRIGELKKQARTAPNLPEKLALQKRIRNLDRKRDEAWREYDRAAREIEQGKDELIDQVESRLRQEIEEETLFSIRWKLV